MNISLGEAAAADYKHIRKLYKKAFPIEERAPFLMIKKNAMNGKAQMLVVKDKDEFIGFLYLVCHLDMAYLFFFAIEPDKWGKGYGSKVLGKLKEIYEGKRLFLAREQLDERSNNYRERVKRHEFYLHNGFEDLPCRIKEAGVIYDVMGTGGKISAEEYDALISSWTGKWIRKIVDMRIIE